MRRIPSSIALTLIAAAAACTSGGAGTSSGAAEPADGPRLLVVNKSSNSLSVMDPDTREEVGAVATGFAPHEVAVSADGATAYVTDYGTGPRPGSTVSVVDLEDFDRSRILSLEPHARPHGVAVAPDGTLWVTTEGSRHVLHLDPVSGELLHEVETEQETTHMVLVAPERERVVTANIGSGTVTVVDAAAGRVITHLETGAGAEGLDLHPDGRRVYVTNREDGTLAEVDLETNRVSRTLEVGDFPIRVRVRPGGEELLVSNARGNEVVAVDVDGWEVVRRLPVGAVPVGILVTPDGGTAFVANTQDDRITVVDLERWEVIGEVVAGEEPDGMAWIAE